MICVHVSVLLLGMLLDRSAAWLAPPTVAIAVPRTARAAVARACADGESRAPAPPPAAAAASSTPAPSAPSALSLLAATAEEVTVSPTTGAACSTALAPDQRRRNVVLAIAAPLSATAFYGFQRANPVNPVALLARMEERSPALPDALATGRPTLVEFYAPWCTSCKESAPFMLRLEKQYAGRVNFVVVNGDDPRNEQLVRLFGVDGIPHMALISDDRQLAGTLIGAIPEKVVDASLDALAAGKPLPYGRAEEAA